MALISFLLTKEPMKTISVWVIDGIENSPVVSYFQLLISSRAGLPWFRLTLHRSSSPFTVSVYWLSPYHLATKSKWRISQASYLGPQHPNGLDPHNMIVMMTRLWHIAQGEIPHNAKHQILNSFQDWCNKNCTDQSCLASLNNNNTYILT